MKKICITLLVTCLFGTLLTASETRDIVVSKFKIQAKTITPLSITKFEVTDKHGNTKIMDLKGQKIIVV